ncbi:MAG: HAMP domain-containing protein [Microcoleus sp. CSU_2_2]|nr:HAMP domain-containing protein [Microcoleus sp. CSU_2_2]
MIKARIVHWLRRLQVQQKITWGYGLSLGIAIAGTSLGIVLADQQQRQAEAMGKDALEELKLITSLQVDMLQTFTEQQHVRESLSQPLRLRKHYAEWQDNYKQFRQSWEEFKQTKGGTKGQEKFERAGEAEAFDAFLKKYKGVPEAYFQAVDRLRSNFDPTAFTPEAGIRLRTSLIQLDQSRLLLEQIDDLGEDLKMLATITQEEYEDAQRAISSSNALRLWVIGMSMAVSVAIAIVLSLLTSQTIARPIQSLTQVTQQALGESNFGLQAPVMTEDEIGTLAVSFNQLIASVKTLLDRQQEYSQTLEMKVTERTQELSDKNIQLQELVEKLHSTQVQMVQSEKMSALGQLVAGVAHEINNPVNFIYANLTHVREYAHNLLNFVQLYQKHYPTPVSEIDSKAAEIDLEFLQEDLPKLLSSMQIGTDRIRDIVVSLRNFSRVDQAEFKTVNIHEGIDSTLLILQHRLKASSKSPEIRLVRDYGDLPLVKCYPGQLNQVVMNILANAIEALEEFNVKRTYQELKERPSQIEICTSTIDSQWVQITIVDNASGMTEEIKQQIFNPFFTTKPIGKGTGMGMAISYQIITEKHGGKLECFSTFGEGTQFIIKIPIK